MIDNTGKVALIFGVRNELSLSWAIAKSLHDAGCKVGISYLPETKEELLFLMEQAGMDVKLTHQVDVRQENEIKEFAEKVHQEHGRVDYVLHGTAYGNHRVLCRKALGGTEAPGTFLDIDLESLQESVDISAYSLIRICRVLSPYFEAGASILTLSYNASQRVVPAYAGMSISKAALEVMVRYLSQFFGVRGIRVNALSPGLVMTTSAAALKGVRSLRKLSRENSPLGNVDADAVAHAALYYFSDLSLQVTGNLHYVDGGINIMGVQQ